MQTPSHMVIAAAVAKGIAPVPVSTAVLLGSVAPDLPLITLSIFGGLYYTQIKKMPAKEAASLMFDTLFFKNKVWIALHNTLHSPLLLIALLVPLFFLIPLSGIALGLFWFLLSCLLHTAIDIPTHHNDGPLLFFPLEWQTRFESPISYWDTKRGAKAFMVFEFALVLVLLIYLFADTIKTFLG